MQTIKCLNRAALQLNLFYLYLSTLTVRRRFRSRRRSRRREHHLPLARRRRRPFPVGRRRRRRRHFGLGRGGAPLHRFLGERRRQRRARPAVVRVVPGVFLHVVSVGAFPPSVAVGQRRVTGQSEEEGFISFGCLQVRNIAFTCPSKGFQLHLSVCVHPCKCRHHPRRT